MIVAKFYPFVYPSVLCSHFEPQFRSAMKPKVRIAKNRFKALQCLIYLSNEMIKLSMGCKNIKESQRKISSISLKISGKIKECFPEIVGAALSQSVGSFASKFNGL